MVVTGNTFERLYHLEYMPLPGGDAAVKAPYRIAYAYLKYCGLNTSVVEIDANEKKIIDRQLDTGFNLFYTSSMGRLFDAVDSILGRKRIISFDGEAAIDLEFLATLAPIDANYYPYDLKDGSIKLTGVLGGILKDLEDGISAEIIARKFHNTVINFTVDCISAVTKMTGIKKIAFSGGVFQNRILLSEIQIKLNNISGNDIEIFIPREVPMNDGSISFGQAVIANVYG